MNAGFLEGFPLSGAGQFLIALDAAAGRDPEIMLARLPVAPAGCGRRAPPGRRRKCDAASGRPEIKPVAQRFGDMGAAHPLDAGQVSQRPGHLKHAVVGAGREVEALGRL